MFKFLGAASQMAINEIVLQLKAAHRNNYTAAEINWQQWGNKIAATDPHRREELINAPPPDELIYLFRPAHVDDIPRQTHRSVLLAQTVNEGVIDDVKDLRMRLTAFKNHLDRGYQLYDDIDKSLFLLESRLGHNCPLLESMAESVQPFETEFSHEVFVEIDDLDDVDHLPPNNYED